MTLEQRLNAVFQAIAADYKQTNTNIGTLAGLSTTAKNSLVGAVNELYNLITNGVGIDDAATAGTTKTYSIDKIKAVVAQAKADLLGGVPSTAFDTLKEIADYIATDQTAGAGITTALGLRVRVDAAQSFTAPQMVQGRANIGALSTVEVGNTDADFVAVYVAAKA
jgi:hypothetical protein